MGISQRRWQTRAQSHFFSFPPGTVSRLWFDNNHFFSLQKQPLDQLYVALEGLPLTRQARPSACNPSVRPCDGSTSNAGKLMKRRHTFHTHPMHGIGVVFGTQKAALPSHHLDFVAAFRRCDLRPQAIPEGLRRCELLQNRKQRADLHSRSRSSACAFPC